MAVSYKKLWTAPLCLSAGQELFHDRENTWQKSVKDYWWAISGS